MINVASAKKVVVEEGKTANVELERQPRRTGKLEVRIKDEEGTVFIDGSEGRRPATGQGDLPLGEHEVESHAARLRALHQDGESHRRPTCVVETVVLRKSAEGDTLAEQDEGDWTFDGIYGGLNLGANFFPIGTGNSVEDSCDALGCDELRQAASPSAATSPATSAGPLLPWDSRSTCAPAAGSINPPRASTA